MAYASNEMQSMKADIAPYLNREWQVDLYETPMKRPFDCLFGGVCCCAGLCQFGPLGEPQPEVPGLCCEVLLCPQMALSANRFFVQSRFGLMNTQTDNALMASTAWIGMCANYAACFMEMTPAWKDFPASGKVAAEIASKLTSMGPELYILADLAFLCLNGCMYAQQQVEIDEMQGRGYRGASQAVLQALPPKLQALMGQAPNQFMMS
eukprot:g18804.t1